MISVVENSNIKGDQKWHARITSTGNYEPLMIGENVSSSADAMKTIVAVAEEFGIIEPNVQRIGDYFYLRSRLMAVTRIEHVRIEMKDNSNG